MTLKTFKPYTKSTRGTVVLDKSSLWKGAPYKPLTKGQNFTGGRNNNGRITSRHIGGGSKHKYRIIDFYRKKESITGTVERIEYDPNRTAYIALITYEDKEKSYIISPKGLKKGDKIVSGKNIEIKIGNSLLSDIINCFDQLNESSKVRIRKSVFLKNISINSRFKLSNNVNFSNLFLPPFISIFSLILISFGLIYYYDSIEDREKIELINLK